MTFEESTTDSECACSGDGLCNDETVESAGSRTVCEESSGLGEFGDSSDSGVLLIQLCGHDFVFGGSYGGEDVWLSLVVTVCANTCE